MTLPKMDVPVGIVEWEVFVPDSYAVKAIDGNVIDRARSRSRSTESDDSERRTGVSQRRGAEPWALASGIGAGVAAASRGGLSPAPAAAGQRARGGRKVNEAQKQEPSQNVINLQKRAAGVLPVRVDVPRAGTSHQFVKPLVVDQETFVNLRYKRR